ncbi:MAG: hypothetical protein IPK17_39525 [Chloroflexi bacterium]|uniref:hypothetical protein n=1 Tax=Candidatus Flexifilum breve TaxID=3140694 RepID=UPI0031362BBB|nr:hypothetical protein [Chloroflexota bacterium]
MHRELTPDEIAPQFGDTVLLLDEVVAELDSQRRAYLLERIDGVTQTLVTTTELDIFTRPFLDRAAIWRVTDGRIDIHAGEKPRRKQPHPNLRRRGISSSFPPWERGWGACYLPPSREVQEPL